MAEKSRAGLIVLIIFCVIFAGLAAFLVVLQQQEYTKRISLEGELEDSQSQLSNLQTELRKVREDKENIEKNMDELKEKAELLEKQIESEKREKKTVSTKLKDRELELSSLKSTLDETKGNLKDIETKYTKLELDNDELVASLVQLKMAKKALEAKMGISGVISEGDGIELGTVVVRPISVTQAEGRILVVNKEFNFVVIDLGQINGVEVGAKFGIYRDNVLLAEVQVEKVYNDMCSAIILTDTQQGQIQEDDQVQML